MRLRFAALGLDRVTAGVLHESCGVGQGTIHGVVTLVGHAAEHKSVGRAAAYGGRVHDHHVHGGRDGVRVAVCDHRETVADYGDIDARRFGPLGRSVVGHRHVHHLFTAGLGVADFLDIALFALCSLCRLGHVRLLIGC